MLKVFLPILFLASAVTVFGTTAGVTPCATATLATYDNSYPPPLQSCSIGILDYSNFSYSALSNAPTAADIEVTPDGQGFSFSQVGGAPFVANGDIVQFAIYYNIFIDPAPVIPGARSNLDPPAGDVNVTEYFCNDSILYPNQTSCFPPTSPAYSLTVTTASPTASITFATPATSYETVGIVFTLNGTNGPASFDGLDATTDVATAPEPASALLVGLVVLAGGYRIRKQRQN